jgi:hypothetical protein
MRAMLNHIEFLEDGIERLSTEIETLTAPFSAQIELLDTIPGVNRRSAEMILAEIGPGMSRFPSAHHLASWAGLCPGNNESADKRFSGKTRKGSKWLRAGLTESGEAAARSKGTYFAARYARIKGSRRHKKAIVAVAHSILVIAYHILKDGQPYNELGADYFTHRRVPRATRPSTRAPGLRRHYRAGRLKRGARCYFHVGIALRAIHLVWAWDFARRTPQASGRRISDKVRHTPRDSTSSNLLRSAYGLAARRHVPQAAHPSSRVWQSRHAPGHCQRKLAYLV